MRGRGLRHLRNTLLRYRPQMPSSASVSWFQRRLTSGTRLPGVDGARRACTDEILRPVGQILAAELLGPGGTAEGAQVHGSPQDDARPGRGAARDPSPIAMPCTHACAQTSADTDVRHGVRRRR